jgi:hypothetical protein
LSKEETRKKKNIEEDKYIYYGTKHAKSEASDPNEIEKTGLMMQKRKGK